ncbi:MULTISPECIES: hypothetical protein [Listeria]|uniref:hypothetical protein n=1 Tax=Listeria TaxID=1637 RepID=UPI000B588380|nr:MULTISPECIES: hypothetical protein [Listeria]
MLTVIIQQAHAAQFMPKELSLLDFTQRTHLLTDGETFEVELLNPQKVPFYVTNYEPGTDGRFDLYLMQRMKQLRKQKKMDKARYLVIQKWIEESCSEIVAISEPSSPSPSFEKPKRKGRNEPSPKDKKKPTPIQQEKPVKTKKTNLPLRSIPWKWPSLKRTFLKKSAFLILGLFLMVSVGFGASYLLQEHSQAQEKAKPNVKALQQKKAYHTFLNVYPKTFWKWEQQVVEKKDIATLKKVYQQTKERNVAFDLAFLEKKYERTILLYQANSDVLTMTDLRQDSLTYSYIQEGQLDLAQKQLTEKSSAFLYEEMGWAYLEKGQIRQAEESAKKAKRPELIQQLQDYQLIETTLKEVDKQVKRKNLAAPVKKKLLENQKELKSQLEALKKRPGKESEAQ